MITVIPKYDPITSLTLLYVLLGPACNMHCRHCSQLPIKLNKMPTECLENVVQWIRTLSVSGNKRIYFWGGEPLLYLSEIKIIVNRLNGRNFKFAMTSNGLLLTKEVVSWLNENNIEYVLSYDDPNPTAMRSNEPSPENCKEFLSLSNRKICTVTAGVNCNIEESITWLENKFPNTTIVSGLIQIISDIPADTYAFDFDKCMNGLDISAQKIVNGQDLYGNRLNFWRRKIERLGRYIEYKDVIHQQLVGTPRPTCGSGQTSMSIDLHGNVYPCHNSSICVGNISENPTEIWEKTNEVWKKLIPPNCFNCEQLDICRTRCAIAQLSADRQEYTQCSAFLKKYWELCKKVIYKYNLFDYV